MFGVIFKHTGSVLILEKELCVCNLTTLTKPSNSVCMLQSVNGRWSLSVDGNSKMTPSSVILG